MEHIKTVLQKMCELVGADYNQIDFKKQGWFLLHTWTNERESEFKTWLTDYFIQNKSAFKEFTQIYYSKKNIKRVVEEFTNDYGWKYNE